MKLPLFAACMAVATFGLGPVLAAPAVSAADDVSPPAGPLSHLIVGSTGTPLVKSFNVTRQGAVTAAPGTPPVSGLISFGMAVSPDGRFVYEGNTAGGTIFGYRLNHDGSLTSLPQPPLVTGGTVVGITFSPDGKRIFVALGYALIGQILSYDVGSDGTLARTAAPPVTYGLTATLGQTAVSSDGRMLIASSYTGGEISTYSIGSDARLTKLDGPVRTDGLSTMPVLTQDGRFVYISNEKDNTISGFSISASGTLTPTPGSPYPNPGAHGEAITPDGRFLYAPSTSGVAAFSVGDRGQLTPLPGSPYAGTSIDRVLLSPDNKMVFALQSFGSPSSAITSYVRRADGTLAPSGQPATDTGLFFEDGATAFFAPNQGPSAVLRSVGRARGLVRTFSALGSTDTDGGTVVRYDWTFGDGRVAVTSVPSVRHRFSRPGPRTVTLRVTDDQGCSNRTISDGMAMTCHGNPGAMRSLRIAVTRRSG